MHHGSWAYRVSGCRAGESFGWDLLLKASLPQIRNPKPRVAAVLWYLLSSCSLAPIIRATFCIFSKEMVPVRV